MEGIKKCVVKEHNNMVGVHEFQYIKQQSSELVTSYVVRLNDLGNICNFKIKCIGNTEVSYVDKMKIFQIVKGLADIEMQKRVLAKATEGTMELTYNIKMAKAI